MKPSLQSVLRLLPVIVITVCAVSMLSAQRRDTLQAIQTFAGPYQSCFDLLVKNGQLDSNIRISEFRLRIVSGRARFIAGATQSPFNWTISQTASTATWASNAASSDIRKGETKGGFYICVQDTGVFRMVWETRTIDSLISRDTIAFAGRKYLCDEAFFRVQPSRTVCIADIDLVGGNGTGRLVNDFRLHILTPGVTFNTAPSLVPPGWVRLKSKPDSIVFFTQNKGLDVNQFVEGFRIELLGVQPDSLVEIEWWTANFGDQLCVDTARFTCDLSVGDSVASARIGTGPDSCCQTLRLKNTHIATSPIDAFTLKILTPGARFAADPTPPPNWTRVALAPPADSVTFNAANGGALAYRDTALFGNLCFNNAGAASDTVRYQWQTFGKGVPIASGIGASICIRPLTALDSVSAVVDSTVGATQRCISLTLKNRNSRRTPITRFVVRIANAGTQRTIRSATAPSPWRVESFGGDSAVFASGQIVAGGGAGPFVICTSQGDATTRDPLTIRWKTSNALGTISSDSLKVNAIITSDCDSVRATEITPVDASSGCFTVSFLNRNGKNRTLDQFRLDLASQQVIFTSASAPLPWHTLNPALPSFDLEFGGGTLAAGDSATNFTFCMDITQLPSLPATVPVVARTFSQGALVCTDTVNIVVTGAAPNACDTVPLISYSDSAVGGCRLGFRVINRHSPGTPVDGIVFRIAQGTGVFVAAQATGGASGWSAITRGRDSVLFRGSSLAAGAATDTFFVQIDSSNGSDITIQGCTLNGDQVVCCSQRNVQCNTSGVELSFEPTGFRLYDNTPNPFSSSTLIRYDLLHASHVTITIRDGAGRELRNYDRGRQEAGSQQFSLDLRDMPAGVYYYTLQAGGEVETKRMILVK